MKILFSVLVYLSENHVGVIVSVASSASPEIIIVGAKF